MKNRDEQKATYKVAEAARVAGCGERSIRDGIADGRIPHIKFGRNIFIPKRAFHAWLDSCDGTRTTPIEAARAN